MADMPTPEFVQTNGVRIAVYRAGPTPGTVTKPTVVLMHGFPEIAYSWRAQIVALADAGYPVIAYDARGYGLSDAPEGVENYSYVQLTGDAAGILDHYGIEKALFVGHDWGALTLWAMPFYMPERVLGYAGLNVPLLPLHRKDPVEMLKDRFGERMYIVMFQQEGRCEPALERDLRKTFAFFMRKPRAGKARATPGASDIAFAENSLDLIGLLEAGPDHWGGELLMDDDELDIYVQAYARNGFTPPLHWYRNMSQNWRDMQRFLVDGKLPFVNAPCLQFTAELDRACPPRIADGMEDRCAPYERVDLMGSGHWSQQEKADEVNRALLDWLGRHFPV